MGKAISLLLCITALASGDFVGHSQEGRQGRQDGAVQGGVDFSGCTTDQETGLCCVEKEETVYESSCTTKYVEKQPGKFVGDTSCEKLPIEICGAGCTYEEGEEECHDKTVASVVDVPEESCDLNPQKTCRYVTKLVPRLSPAHECTIVPKETCILKFSPPQQVDKPLLTKWCLDPTPAAPGESYDENDALGAPLG